MRYKHLRKFNESAEYDLSFDSFKDIMTLLTDLSDTDPVFINNVGRTLPDGSRSQWSNNYMCEISIPKIREEADNIDISLEYLSRSIPGYPHRSDRPIRHRDYEEVVECVDNQIEYLKNCIDNIESVIQTSKDVKSYMDIYKNDITPIFEKCNNFLETNVGFNVTASKLRITFEIKY